MHQRRHLPLPIGAMLATPGLGFTVVATLLAHPFWAFEGPDRGRQAATFFEHLAIVGGFAAAALLAHRGDVRP